jgi:hypothetical protein
MPLTGVIDPRQPRRARDVPTAGALCVSSETKPSITSAWLTSRGEWRGVNGMTPELNDTPGQAIGKFWLETGSGAL